MANHRKYNRETCYRIALECDSRYHFQQKNSTAYRWALKNGWLQDYVWFRNIREEEKYTREEVEKESRKYDTLKEFREKSPHHWNWALRHGMLKEFTWLENHRIDIVYGRIYSVYCYVFEEFHAVYVGLSLKPRKRDSQHRDGKSRSSVFSFAKEKSVDVPEMKILEEGLT